MKKAELLWFPKTTVSGVEPVFSRVPMMPAIRIPTVLSINVLSVSTGLKEDINPPALMFAPQVASTLAISIIRHPKFR
jgi:hypothetical protein